MKVRCIDNEDWIGVLTTGKIYEVVSEGSWYKILGDDEEYYHFNKEI